MMRYNKVKKGIFIRREKRFIGYVEIEGKVEKVHVKQTGRCEELLIPGVTVFIETALNLNRKTKYTLIAVIKPNGRLVNIDSQIPNKVFHEALDSGFELHGFHGPYEIIPETTYGNSRFDFKLISSDDSAAWVEIKGVTLEENGVVLFPDAPTERGLKHVRELIKATEEGYNTYIIFIIQMHCVKHFMPNMSTHPEFGHSLREARKSGVEILAFDTTVDEDSIKLNEPVKVIL